MANYHVVLTIKKDDVGDITRLAANALSAARVLFRDVNDWPHAFQSTNQLEIAAIRESVDARNIFNPDFRAALGKLADRAWVFGNSEGFSGLEDEVEGMNDLLERLNRLADIWEGIQQFGSRQRSVSKRSE